MTGNPRHQKRYRVRNALTVQTSAIEAWPSKHMSDKSTSNMQQSIDSLQPGRKFASLSHNDRLDIQANSTYSSIAKPIPPAHGVVFEPAAWSPGQLHQSNITIRPVPHQGNTMKRAIACHPRRTDGVEGLQVREVMRINPLYLFFVGFIPPFLGAIASIGFALFLHNDEISNYNWQCGRARLPSLSRIINLPMERIFWQCTFLFHVPLRLIELAVGFSRYGRLRSVTTKYPRLYTISRYLYAIIGVLELIFMIALSIVGEREFIAYHVMFFYAFGSCVIGFFAVNSYCHANSLYYLNPYGRISYYTKLIVLFLYILSVPILLGAFFMYWKQCITYMYEIFALTEYADVFLSIIYHCCAFYDIRYKVVFSVRSVKQIKYN